MEADERYVELDTVRGKHRQSLRNLSETLAAQGLHIVTAAEKSVLDSVKAARIIQTDYGPHMYVDDVEDITSKELARRGTK